MNKKISKISFFVGAFLPLYALGIEQLENITVKENKDKKAEYKEKKFFKSYSSELFIKSDLEEESIVNVKDMIKNVSGVTVKDTGSFNKSLKIRGLGGERVSSIVDGTKMSNHGMSMGGGGELGLIESSSVENIEIIKGSPSIVYDPGASGGIVKVNTIPNMLNLKDKIKLKHTFANDNGHKLIKNNTSFELNYQDFYIQAMKGNTDSNGYNVKNKDKLKKFIFDTNIENDTVNDDNKIKNLGYESESQSYVINYNINDNTNIYYKNYENLTNDSTFIYGMYDPKAVHYKKYNTDGDILGVRLVDQFGFSKIDFYNSNINIYKMTLDDDNVITEVELNSNTKKIATEYPFDNLYLLTGIENTYDKARTFVHSRMNYNALYSSGEYMYNEWTFIFGARYNHHTIKKDMRDGDNIESCKDKVGISGCTEDRTDSKVNYSAGIIYGLNNNTNLAVNYSRTYRYPSLYDRFAYEDGVLGGGMELEAEEADNLELSWKYLDDTLAYNIALFQSDFETYNAYRTDKSLKDEYQYDLDEYLQCLDDDICNPFTSTMIQSNFTNVVSKGFEIDIEKKFEQQDITTQLSLNKTAFSQGNFQNKNMQTPSPYKFNQEPLEVSTSVKKKFNVPLKPWIKLKLRHVTNNPRVEQEDGFSAFSVGDLYFGFKYKKYFTFNGGIKNISDNVYHEAYSPIDGVKRTFFFNASVEFEKLL